MKRAISFLLYSSIFISICAVALAIETNCLFHIPLNGFAFYLLIFCATLVQYNLHYYVKRSANPGSDRFLWSQVNKRTHIILIFSGAVGGLVSLFFIPTLRHFIVLGIIGAITVLYSMPLLPFRNRKRLKDFGLIKILILAEIWTLITVWFPSVSSWSFSLLDILIFMQRFLFMFVLCLAFDIRDVHTDSIENIHTLPVAIGEKNSYLIINMVLIIFVGISIWQFSITHQFIQLNAMILSAIITYWVIDYSRQHHHDAVYLSLIDGMMLLQAILVGLGGINGYI